MLFWGIGAGRIRVWIPAELSLLRNLSLTTRQPEARAEQHQECPGHSGTRRLWLEL